MFATRRTARAAAFLSVGLALSGCGATPESTSPPEQTAAPATTEAAAASASPSAAAPVGLQNVSVEPRLAGTGDIGPDGGSVSATGSNGVVYTLTLPKNALVATTTIALYPVTSVAGLPGASSISAGVQFGPDGLVLQAPGTLTIQLPPGTSAQGLTAVAWRGDAFRPHLYPSGAVGQVVTLQVIHFSGVALDPSQIEATLNCADFDYACVNDKLEQDIVHDETLGDARTAMVLTLRLWYVSVVEPALNGNVSEFDGHESRPWTADLEASMSFYQAWHYAIYSAGVFLGDPRFTIPEASLATQRVTAALRAFAGATNWQCDQDKDLADASEPVGWADLGITRAFSYAAGLDVATRANRLDQQTLLDESCVQVVIDPARKYSALIPGDVGTVTVPTGFSIAGGPIRHDLPIIATLSLVGDSVPFDVAGADSDGNVMATLPWPDNVDPVKIDVLVRLAIVKNGSQTLTSLARFDRITKRAERLLFTFDGGFDGWSSDTARSGSWGSVDHFSLGGGVMHLDGRGDPSRPNAWIFRTINLPEFTRTLLFDASAEIIAGSSSEVRVRVVDGSGSATTPWFKLHNATNHLSFTRETLDLSPWAGQRVTIYIEQNDNTPAGGTGFDKEIYVDNIRIVVS